MIPNSETNFLWLASSLLEAKYSEFLAGFQSALHANSIAHDFLPHTKDIWAVDFMPVQLSEDRFVQFVYNPDYLRNYPKWKKTISDVDQICNAIGMRPKLSPIVLDGGNAAKHRFKAVLCDKVFEENPSISKTRLISLLMEELELDELYFIPWDRNDLTGHADGMVRFIDERTVLVNAYAREPKLLDAVTKPLKEAGLDCIPVPYHPYNNSRFDDATGIYINYLQMSEAVFIPTFGIREDEAALAEFERIFKKVVPVRSEQIATGGGILSCISWNIKK